MSNTEYTKEELEAQLEALRSENATLKANRAANRQIKIKTSEKGGVSLYNVHRRFPVTLYARDWQRVLDMAPQIREYIEQNRASLAWKDEV